MEMAIPSLDAQVFFGATGDPVYKKIFPALQAMIKRGELWMPIAVVSRVGWSLHAMAWKNTIALMSMHSPSFPSIGAEHALQAGDSKATLAQFAQACIDINALAARLQREGTLSSVKSWQHLKQRIASKSQTLVDHGGNL